MTVPTNKDHRLYILMRTDMASMNPGKACAQAAHAANKFTRNPDLIKGAMGQAYIEWSESAGPHIEGRFQGFGTTITLSVNENALFETINIAKENGLPSGLVFDPTYPLRDGDFTHLISIVTCGYIFIPEHLTCQVPRVMLDLELMK